MASIILPSRWQSQPQYSVGINRGDGLTRDLVVAINGATPEINLATGQLNNYTALAPLRRACASGLAVDSGGGANSLTHDWVWASGGMTAYVLLVNNTASTIPNINWVTGGITFGRNYDAKHKVRIGAGTSGVSSSNDPLFNTGGRTFAFAGTVAGSWGAGTVYDLTTGRAVQTGSGTVGALSTATNIACAVADYQILTLLWNRVLSVAELNALAENPWQIFRKQKQILYFDAGAGGPATHNLEGAAAAQASATSALSVSVPLAGAGIAVATASGAMSVSIPLAGAAQAQAGASGALAVTGDASLAGNATATASASGGLSLSIPLAGGAVAQAMAAAGLSQSVALGGDATAAASATGALTLNVSLAGAAIAQAAADAGLTVTGASSLAGDAQASASASGALSVGVPLSGAALTVASADGSLTHIVPLSGYAASASLATGGLDVSVSLSAAALAQAMAAAGLTVEQGSLAGTAMAEASSTGTLTLRINLSGEAVSQAVASGALTTEGLIVGGTPGWRISAEARDWVISAEARDWSIAA